MLKLRLPAKVLTELPADLARLKSLTTLIVSHNSLKALPEDMKALKHLKNLEFTDNKVYILVLFIPVSLNISLLHIDMVFYRCRYVILKGITRFYENLAAP